MSCSQEKEGPTEKSPPSPVHSEREALLVGKSNITFLHQSDRHALMRYGTNSSSSAAASSASYGAVLVVFHTQVLVIIKLH